MRDRTRASSGGSTGRPRAEREEAGTIEYGQLAHADGAERALDQEALLMAHEAAVDVEPEHLSTQPDKTRVYGVYAL